MLTIGSWALRHHNLLSNREPRDFDIIVTWDEFNNIEEHKHAVAKYPISDSKWVVRMSQAIFEYEIAWQGSTSAELLERVGDRTMATPAECLALKLSHRYLKNSPHFMKTMLDIAQLRAMGVKLDEWLEEWVKRRELETYDYAHPALDRSKEEFFSDDAIDYRYDHDSLHEAVKLNIRPAYTYFQDGEVYCNMDKFDALPHSYKIAAVWEESAVLALERSVIPFDGDPLLAFTVALKKVCTSITSGRFREFAWEHYSEVFRMNFDLDYVAKFHRGLETGVVEDSN